ncbi:MAG: hypothetical protein KF752_14610 [Pirellulaceae bacterium]|nr:hypothetical protein [Pirellulaceae bacterium]
MHSKQALARSTLVLAHSTLELGHSMLARSKRVQPCELPNGPSGHTLADNKDHSLLRSKQVQLRSHNRRRDGRKQMHWS